MISLFKNRSKNPADEVRKKRKAYRLKNIKNDINQLESRKEILLKTAEDIDAEIEEKKKEFERIKSEHDDL